MNLPKINMRVAAGAHYRYAQEGGNRHADAQGLIPLTIATDSAALARSDPTIFKLSKPDLRSLKKSKAPKQWKNLYIFSPTLILLETSK